MAIAPLRGLPLNLGMAPIWTPAYLPANSCGLVTSSTMSAVGVFRGPPRPRSFVLPVVPPALGPRTPGHVAVGRGGGLNLGKKGWGITCSVPDVMTNPARQEAGAPAIRPATMTRADFQQRIPMPS